MLRNAEISPDELTALIVESYFCPSDDIEADAYDTQRNAFVADAQHLAMTLLEGDDQALIHTIADVTRHEVLWRLPRERDVTITTRGDDIDVTLKTAPDSRQTEHLGRSVSADDDVGGVAEQVLASFRTALGPVVIRAAVAARDPNRSTGQIAQLLQCLDQARIEFGPAAAAAVELVAGEVTAQITHGRLLRDVGRCRRRSAPAEAALR